MEWLANLFGNGGILEGSGNGMETLMSDSKDGYGKGGLIGNGTPVPMMDFSQPEQIPSLMNEGLMYSQAQPQQPQMSLMEILRNRRMGY